MSQQHETGHAKNVANLQKLIEQITVYTNYNPSIENLKVDEVTTLYNNAIASLSNTKNKKIANKDTIYIRQELYTNLKSKSTRIINHLDVLNLKEGTFNQAKSINKLIQGYKKITKIIEINEDDSNEEENQNKETKSTSRQSFTELAENFSNLLQLLATISNYNPNTEEIKLENLNTYYDTIIDATKAVNKSEAELNIAYITRNDILYNEEKGLYEIAQNIKKYVKSLYGATSVEYANVSKIKFTNM